MLDLEYVGWFVFGHAALLQLVNPLWDYVMFFCNCWLWPVLKEPNYALIIFDSWGPMSSSRRSEIYRWILISQDMRTIFVGFPWNMVEQKLRKKKKSGSDPQGPHTSPTTAPPRQAQSLRQWRLRSHLVVLPAVVSARLPQLRRCWGIPVRWSVGGFQHLWTCLKLFVTCFHMIVVLLDITSTYIYIYIYIYI